VFAVRLVPDGNNFNTACKSLHAGLQLGLSLMRESVAGSNGILAEMQFWNDHFLIP
jgi:hypothetical protein